MWNMRAMYSCAGASSIWTRPSIRTFGKLFTLIVSPIRSDNHFNYYIIIIIFFFGSIPDPRDNRNLLKSGICRIKPCIYFLMGGPLFGMNIRIIWFLSSHCIELTGGQLNLIMRSLLNRPHKSGVKAGNGVSKLRWVRKLSWNVME